MKQIQANRRGINTRFSLLVQETEKNIKRSDRWRSMSSEDLFVFRQACSLETSSCLWSTIVVSKFSGDNLAEDIMKPEVWRKAFRFLSIMELVRLREVCETFKDEVDFLFGTQNKLGIFERWRGPVHRYWVPDLYNDPYYVPNSSWIRLHSMRQYLPTLKSLFPSVKLLVIIPAKFSLFIFYSKLYIEDIFYSFVDLESFAFNAATQTEVIQI